LWKDRYLARMARIGGVPARDLSISEREQVRYRFDGETPMIDLPRVQTVEGTAYQFDLRNCCALCVDQFSSKAWARVGPPEGHAGYGLAEIRDMTERYRRQAIDAAEWFYDEFFALATDAFRGTERKRDSAVLEVTTIGLRTDRELTQDDNDAWLFDGAGGNLANETLCNYLASAAGVDRSIPELLEYEPRAYWLSVPAVARSRRGLLVSRNVLYLGRLAENLIQFVGIGLDDSEHGDFANDVALKISRLIAGWV